MPVLTINQIVRVLRNEIQTVFCASSGCREIFDGVLIGANRSADFLSLDQNLQRHSACLEAVEQAFAVHVRENNTTILDVVNAVLGFQCRVEKFCCEIIVFTHFLFPFCCLFEITIKKSGPPKTGESALKRNCELYEHRMPFINGIYRTFIILRRSHTASTFMRSGCLGKIIVVSPSLWQQKEHLRRNTILDEIPSPLVRAS